MNRREAIKQTALLTGFAVATPIVTGVLQGCQPSRALDWTPEFLNEDQAFLVADMAECILPKTEDLPGAKEVLVDRFIDKMLLEVYKEKDQQIVVQGLVDVDQRSQTAHGKKFSDCNPEQQLEILNTLNSEAIAKAKAIGNIKDADKQWPAFLKFKQLVLIGYFTSEEVATNVLNYDPIPGGYKDCMPLEEADGKIWAI